METRGRRSTRQDSRNEERLSSRCFKRWSTAGQPRVVNPQSGLTMVCFVRASGGSSRTVVFRAQGVGYESSRLGGTASPRPSRIAPASCQERRELLTNRSSTAHCFPSSVLIGFRLFVLPKRFSGQLSSMPWGARGTGVSWANRPVGVPPCPAPPCPADPHCAAPHRPACGMSGFWIRQFRIRLAPVCEVCSFFPDMPCMKKAYKDK